MIDLILTYTLLALITFLLALFLIIRGNDGIHALKLTCAALVCGALWFLFWPFFVYALYRTIYAPTAGPEPQQELETDQDDAPIRETVS